MQPQVGQAPSSPSHSHGQSQGHSLSVSGSGHSCVASGIGSFEIGDVPLELLDELLELEELVLLELEVDEEDEVFDELDKEGLLELEEEEEGELLELDDGPLELLEDEGEPLELDDEDNPLEEEEDDELLDELLELDEEEEEDTLLELEEGEELELELVGEVELLLGGGATDVELEGGQGVPLVLEELLLLDG